MIQSSLLIDQGWPKKNCLTGVLLLLLRRACAALRLAILHLAKSSYNRFLCLIERLQLRILFYKQCEKKYRKHNCQPILVTYV